MMPTTMEVAWARVRTRGSSAAGCWMGFGLGMRLMEVSTGPGVWPGCRSVRGLWRRPEEVYGGGQEPEGVRDDDGKHAVDIKVEVADGDQEDEDDRGDDAVERHRAGERGGAEGGDAPEENGGGDEDGVDAGERLIELEDGVKHDVPGGKVRRAVVGHVTEKVGQDKAADGSGDEDGDAGEGVEGEGGGREPGGTWGGWGEVAGEASCAEESGDEAGNGDGMGDGGGKGEVLQLGGRELRSGCDGVERHGE